MSIGSTDDTTWHGSIVDMIDDFAQGINYQMVWAMGQTTPNISKVPPGSVNTNTASDRNFYKQDVLMYHGGGTSNYSDVTSPFRGTLGNVDLFAPPLSLTQTTKCAPSPIPVGLPAPSLSETSITQLGVRFLSVEPEAKVNRDG